MSTEEVVTEVVETEVVAFGSVKSEDLDIQFEGDKLEVGSNVHLMDGEEKVSLADGEYELETGEILKVKDGVVESLEAKEEETPEEPAQEVAEELADEAKEEVEEVKEEAPAAITEEDVRRIVEEMVMGFNSEIESLKNENVELSSQIVTLSNQPVAVAMNASPTQSSGYDNIMKLISKRKK